MSFPQEIQLPITRLLTNDIITKIAKGFRPSQIKGALHFYILRLKLGLVFGRISTNSIMSDRVVALVAITVSMKVTV